MRAVSSLMSVLSLTDGSPPAADDLTPVLVLVILKVLHTITTLKDSDNFHTNLRNTTSHTKDASMFALAALPNILVSIVYDLSFF